MGVQFDPFAGCYRVEPELARLQEVRDDYPSGAVKAAAEAALRTAVADLGLPSSTRIIWCVEESSTSRKLRERYAETPWRTAEVPEPARGMVSPTAPDVLWVRANQTPAAVAETIKHECRHGWQLDPVARRWELSGLETMELRESDAAQYASSQPTPVPRSSAPAARPSPAGTMTTATRRPLVTRASRVVSGHREFQCEQCAAWMRAGVTHRCPVGAGLMPDRRLSAGGPNARSRKYAAVPYSVKAV